MSSSYNDDCNFISTNKTFEVEKNPKLKTSKGKSKKVNEKQILTTIYENHLLPDFGLSC